MELNMLVISSMTVVLLYNMVLLYMFRLRPVKFHDSICNALNVYLRLHVRDIIDLLLRKPRAGYDNVFK